MRALINYMHKHELGYAMTCNEDGDDYHLEFIIYNEYYEVRTREQARKLLKYLKSIYSMRSVRKAMRKNKKMLRELEKEVRHGTQV
jgi:hypothetical protein